MTPQYQPIGPWNADEARRMSRYVVWLIAGALGTSVASLEEGAQEGQAIARMAMGSADGRLLDKLPGQAAFGMGMSLLGAVAAFYTDAPAGSGPIDRVRWSLLCNGTQSTIYADPAVRVMHGNLIAACDELLREASDMTDWKTATS